MVKIVKTPREWIEILKGVETLKNRYHYDLFLQSVDTDNLLVRLFNSYGIYDMVMIKELIQILGSFVSIDRIIKDIASLEDKYGIDKLAFISSEGKKKVDTFITRNKYRKVYQVKYAPDIIPYAVVDFKTNGITKEVIPIDHDPFIVDAKDLSTPESSFNERVYYTSNFNFNYEFLPLKEEIKIGDIEQERYYLFLLVIDSLESLRDRVTLKFQDPNQSYDNYGTIRSDGLILNPEGNELVPGSNISFKRILVQDANYVVLAHTHNNEIEYIDLIMSIHYYNSLDDDLRERINSFSREEMALK